MHLKRNPPSGGARSIDCSALRSERSRPPTFSPHFSTSRSGKPSEGGPPETAVLQLPCIRNFFVDSDDGTLSRKITQLDRKRMRTIRRRERSGLSCDRLRVADDSRVLYLGHGAQPVGMGSGLVAKSSRSRRRPLTSGDQNLDEPRRRGSGPASSQSRYANRSHFIADWNVL
jgi:hypothetical protein